MFDPKSVSPLLDGFVIGTSISDHHGISCYPAVKENSDRKFIVKTIAIPALQSQLDALLITGAYPDPASAADYFHSLADEVVQEVGFLRKMSKLQGFLPFEGYQIMPMQKNRIGYDVYLLSGFRLSLERYMHRQNVTHLEAVNLGIDLCSALSACRKEGMLYIALKPANVYISTKKEYKIGDLGFVPLSSLKYISMPVKHRSCYTAPELMDDLAVLNETADTYSVGMILYQIFNNGLLPNEVTAELPAPENADPEIAQIILKACAPNPADRWKDPAEMEQALIAYMQANTINDVPIMDPISAETVGKTGPATFETTRFQIPEALALARAAVTDSHNETEPSQPDAEAEPEAPQPEVTEISEQEPVTDSPAAEPAEEPETDVPESEPTEEEEPAAEDAPVPEEAPTPPAEEEAEAPLPSDEPSEPEAEFEFPELVFQDSDGIAEKIEAAAAAEFAALTGMDESPDAEPMFMDDARLDSELSELNVLLNSTNFPKPEPKQHPNLEPVIIKPEKEKGRVTRFFIRLMLVALLAAACFWGYIFYQTEYLKTVNSLTVSGSLDEMQVVIDSDIPDNLLTVVCTDAYGHATRQRVRSGKATFQELAPDSLYKIQVEINGVHKLVGQTAEIFNTESVTNVVSFTATVGSEDGSAALNLIVDGHEPDQWQVIYTAEGEPELGLTFSGHTAVINNLVLGKHYTFHLETAKHQAVNGQTELEFTAGRVITAQNVTVVSCRDGLMTVQWDSNLGEAAENWNVRCYGNGYDQTLTATECRAEFPDIDPANSYTVEVNAKGMSQIARVSITANPITLTDFHVDATNPQELFLTWDYDGAAPENGWLVLYTLDGGNIPSVLKSNVPSINVVPRIPGAVYHFTIQSADNITVFNSAQNYTCPEAPAYTGHGIAGTPITFRMLQTPETENWSYYSLLSSAYTTSFVSGQSISLVLHCTSSFYLDTENVNILYVFRDEYGNALTELIGEQVMSWHDLWYGTDIQHAELDVPAAPTRPGTYTLDVYLDGMSAGSAQLTVY